MLPLTCFLVDDSKSNSSRRLPFSTTTRVSSEWAASINMRFGIQGKLRRALRPGEDRRAARPLCEEAGCACDHGIERLGHRDFVRSARSASGSYDPPRPALRPGAAAGENAADGWGIPWQSPPSAAPGRAGYTASECIG